MTIKSQLEVPKESSGTTKQKDRLIPIVEIFGPTIQGEGALQGTPCHFIRIGGCDYRCEWCDTPHAVLPNLVRQFSKKMAPQEIVDQVRALTPGPRLVVISGGNPLLFELGHLAALLHEAGYQIAVETQGSKWKPWLQFADSIAVSPKPPSSGHNVDISDIEKFMSRLTPWRAFLKVVVFDELDYCFAKEVHIKIPGFRMFLSAGNDSGATVGNPGRKDSRGHSEAVLDLTNRGRRLANWAMIDPSMSDAQVQMQQHVLYWGNELGR